MHGRCDAVPQLQLRPDAAERLPQTGDRSRVQNHGRCFVRVGALVDLLRTCWPLSDVSEPIFLAAALARKYDDDSAVLALVVTLQ